LYFCVLTIVCLSFVRARSRFGPLLWFLACLRGRLSTRTLPPSCSLPLTLLLRNRLFNLHWYTILGICPCEVHHYVHLHSSRALWARLLRSFRGGCASLNVGHGTRALCCRAARAYNAARERACRRGTRGGWLGSPSFAFLLCGPVVALVRCCGFLRVFVVA